MDWVRHGAVVAVALAACGPSTGGGDEHRDPSESASSESDPSASASATSNGSASASGSGESGTASASTGETGGDTIDTVTATFTEDGPYPPEGGEIGESGDCSCCGSSLHVAWEDDGAEEFDLTMSSPSFAVFYVVCPANFIDGNTDLQAVCGAGEVTLTSDNPVVEFVEETWTVYYDSRPPADEQPAECLYDPGCDCNCVPSSCELLVHVPNDG